MSAVSASVRLGLASAGVGAGLLGFALLGPEIGSAAADSSETSVSMSASDSAGPSRKADRRERIAERRSTAQRARDEQVSDDADSPREDRAARRAQAQQERAERAAKKIDEMTAEAQARIDARPVSDARKDRLEKRLATVRRTFFNQAPTVAPVQVTGVVRGPVTGTVGGVDPDGDRIVYRLADRPESGR